MESQLSLKVIKRWAKIWSGILHEYVEVYKKTPKMERFTHGQLNPNLKQA